MKVSRKAGERKRIDEEETNEDEKGETIRLAEANQLTAIHGNAGCAGQK